jgi:signal peptidase I
MSRRKTFLLVAAVIVAALVLKFLFGLGLEAVRGHVVQAYRIPSRSMEPTILIGDHIYASKRTYQDRAPRRGDLVVYRYPSDPSREFLGRVAAVGGADHRPPDVGLLSWDAEAGRVRRERTGRSLR